VRQAANNEPLIEITVPREQVKKKKYSGINSTVHIRSGFEITVPRDCYRKLLSKVVLIINRC
jgi:hypothetical protein